MQPVTLCLKDYNCHVYLVSCVSPLTLVRCARDIHLDLSMVSAIQYVKRFTWRLSLAHPENISQTNKTMIFNLTSKTVFGGGKK